jgi:predicted ATPase
MIEEFDLTNFKCFSSLQLNFAKLTLLCGINGMGKSSVIQALLLLKQSYKSNELLEGRLALGSELIDLGTGVDILFEDAREDVVGFAIRGYGTELPWALQFDYSRDADRLLAQPKRAHRPPSYVPMEWRPHPPFGGNLTYVSAERLGPRKLHLLSETFARRGDIGAKGEYALNLLKERSSDLLSQDDPRCASASSYRWIDVLDQWLQAITPGAHLELEAIDAADALIAGFTFNRAGDVASRRYRATNVGFGLSYVLPVIIALLSAPGALVLIENPEAHLHPRGQTKMAELAVRAACAGVQVIVETHSDHFMDGVRIAVRDSLILPTEIAFHYFNRADGGASVISPRIDDDGRLSAWPTGFFDQHDDNLARLLAPKQNNA